MDSVLPDELMVKIFRYLELDQDQEALSLVCQRWLNLQRLSRETISVHFTDGTDVLLKRLTDQCANVRNVSIDESPWSDISSKSKRVAMGLINRFPHRNESSLTIRSKPNEMRSYCLTDSGLVAVGDGFAKLESLRLISCSSITDVGVISMAEKCKLLKSLDLERCLMGDKSLAAIGECCTRLETLNLAYCDSLTDAGLVQFALHCGRTLKSLGIRECRGLTDVSLEAVGFHCTSLATLSIALESVNDKGLISIAKGCRLLKSIILQCNNITDEALQAVGQSCSSLELLTLYRCFKLTDKSLYAVGKGCKKLESLCIEGCHSLSESGLDFIAHGCAELIHLEVNCCFNIGSAVLKSIGNLTCTNLSELVLWNLRFQQLDNEALCEIGIECQRLQSLHLIDCIGVPLRGMTRVCRNLKKLYISKCRKIGTEEIICIGENCKSLTELHLRHSFWIRDNELEAIGKACPQLSCLDVCGLENVKDRGIAAVSQGCPFLKDLVISNCPKITDKGLDYISRNCKLLESCTMMSCPGITKFGIKVFAVRCQKLKEIGVEEWKLGYMGMDSIGPRR